MPQLSDPRREPGRIDDLEAWLTEGIRSADWDVERGAVEDRDYYRGLRSALSDVYRCLQRLLNWSAPTFGA